MTDAVVALQRPEGGDHGCRDAVLLLDLGEQVAVLFQAGDAVLDAVLRNQLVGEGQEALGKEALLAVAGDDARIHGHAVQDAGDGRPRDAAVEGLLAESLEPGFEAAGVAARGRVRGRIGRLRVGRREDGRTRRHASGGQGCSAQSHEDRPMKEDTRRWLWRQIERRRRMVWRPGEGDCTVGMQGQLRRQNGSGSRWCRC